MLYVRYCFWLTCDATPFHQPHTYFYRCPPVRFFLSQIYLRKVVEALNSPNGRETFKEIATIMDEIITEWKDYSIPLEKRLEVSLKDGCVCVS